MWSLLEELGGEHTPDEDHDDGEEHDDGETGA
jgi:hypothetical protein